MNVLIIRSTSIFKDSRTIKTVNALLEMGHNVEVIGWDRLNEYPEKIQFIENKTNKAKVTFFDEICPYGNGIKSIFKFRRFQKFIKRYIKGLSESFVIHACDFDTAKPAFQVKGKRLFVYDIFDYFSESRNMPKILKNIIKRQEDKIINNANYVIICTEQRLEQIKDCNPKELLVIHNTPDNLNIDEKSNIFDNKYLKLKVAYIGVLAENRLLYEIFEQSKNFPQIEFHVGGIGKYSIMAKELSETQGNFVYYGSLNYSDVLKIEKECDVLFATYNPAVPNHKYSAPNKFYEAGALSKPIIVCKNTGIDMIVEENNCGLVIDYNVNEFYAALNQLIDNSRLIEKYGKNGNEAYRNKYSWQIMKNKLKTIYKD